MIILGVDPGTAATGYGVLEQKGSSFMPIEYGVIRSAKEKDAAQRLYEIFLGINRVIDNFKPQHLAIEELFFNKNLKTALVVGQARGVIILASHLKGLPVFEYTPLQVKQAVVGYGRAEKQQVQFMVRAILNLPEIPKPDDAADALAVAICHGHSFHSVLR
ncbi:MAG: crossover junction endodeoxyribonuclease RuvC [Peptococcaceae bacterium]|nr:crossover junction endodeoxyribonuclease RuvC [Peptococcaceae bacterium]MDH7525114.1 crossover junction endodeoxyribonuclease RuvC [Peptococcaceae bacterium]